MTCRAEEVVQHSVMAPVEKRIRRILEIGLVGVLSKRTRIETSNTKFTGGESVQIQVPLGNITKQAEECRIPFQFGYFYSY